MKLTTIYNPLLHKEYCASNIYHQLNSFCRTGLKKINLMKGDIKPIFGFKF